MNEEEVKQTLILKEALMNRMKRMSQKRQRENIQEMNEENLKHIQEEHELKNKLITRNE